MTQTVRVLFEGEKTPRTITPRAWRKPEPLLGMDGTGANYVPAYEPIIEGFTVHAVISSEYDYYATRDR